MEHIVAGFGNKNILEWRFADGILAMVLFTGIL
jgi:hypothetical protein